jgi:hypothetical protein
LDPRVVGDAAVFERHVEIRPDEHAPFCHVCVAN